MRRREFLNVLGWTIASPLAARAQERVRHIGIILPIAADDPDFQTLVGAFLQGLQQGGWALGQNLRVDTRWTAGKVADIRKHAAELAALAPDVILAHGASTVAPMLQATRSVPIVFVNVSDPVGAGFIDSLARPGGNATGFMSYEFSIGGKWLELLKQIAPSVTRVGILRDPSQGSGASLFAAIQAVASSFRVETSPVNARNPSEIERAIAAFAVTPGGGLVATPAGMTLVNRDLIVAQAARHKVPMVYFDRFFVVGGGLLSYGQSLLAEYRQAAGYVDRILKGEKPADLPVQAPTKFELVINLKTANALGLTVPPSLLARADEVIE